jgi:hypothetical protein
MMETMVESEHEKGALNAEPSFIPLTETILYFA